MIAKTAKEASFIVYTARAEMIVWLAGIIGISICNALLRKSGGTLSVALVEKHSPCFGATGAGIVAHTHTPFGGFRLSLKTLLPPYSPHRVSSCRV